MVERIMPVFFFSITLLLNGIFVQAQNDLTKYALPMVGTQNEYQFANGNACPCIGDYGLLSLLQTVGERKFLEKDRQSWFTHQSEVAYLNYYKVYLSDPKVIAELTCSKFDNCRGLAIESAVGALLEDITISNIHIYNKGGGTKKMAATIAPEFETRYSDPNNFGIIPGYGFFIRPMKNLIMQEVS